MSRPWRGRPFRAGLFYGRYQLCGSRRCSSQLRRGASSRTVYRRTRWKARTAGALVPRSGGHAHHGLQAAGAGGQDGAARVQPGRAADEPGAQGPGHDEQGRGTEHQGRHGADLQQGAAGHHVADHDTDGDLGPQLEQAWRVGLHMSQHLDGQDGHHGAQHGTAGDVQEEEQQAARDAAGDEEQEGGHGASVGCRGGDHDAAIGERRSRLRGQRFFGAAGTG